MKIYIYNCPNTFNYGSMMMGENFISYFNKVSNTDNKYFVETDNKENTDRLKKATGISEIYNVDMNSLFVKGNRGFDYIYGYLGLKNNLSDFIKEIDVVVVLGGDDFTEDYGWKGPILNAIKFNVLKRKGLRVIMLGQTMGPYHPLRKHFMKTLLSKIDKIYPRDPLTYQYLNKIGLRNISITDDLALLPLTKQELNERTKEYITYCPSELIYKYSREGDRKDWIDYNLFMIDLIMERYSEKKLVLLAHVLKPDHVDDRIIANELYSLIIEKYSGRIILKTDELYPFEVRNYIQKSLFTISSRMHPVISSIQCEVPAIALSYSSKYWGIIGERYELGDFILDVRLLNYEEMKKQFTFLINEIESEYLHIQEKMANKNKQANETILKSLEEIHDLR